MAIVPTICSNGFELSKVN